MLIEQSYEPLNEYNEYSLELVLNLPKKVMVDSLYIYTLELKFIEPTYLHIKYTAKNKQTLVEAKINLNKDIVGYIETLYDYFNSNGIVIINGGENEAYGDNRKCITSTSEC